MGNGEPACWQADKRVVCAIGLFLLLTSYLLLQTSRTKSGICQIFSAFLLSDMAKTKKAKKKEKPVILITNDDGITAPGIHNLVEAVKDLGKVVVVAPDKPQSGMGHAITIGQPLRLGAVNSFFDGVEAYQCSGTPVDCVKLAVDKILHR